jgi:hypothetical protein
MVHLNTELTVTSEWMRSNSMLGLHKDMDAQAILESGSMPFVAFQKSETASLQLDQLGVFLIFMLVLESYNLTD